MTSLCRGCGEELTSLRTALSRYGHEEICSDCGTLEAFHGDFIKRYSADLIHTPAENLKYDAR